MTHTSNPGALMQTSSTHICKDDCDLLKQFISRVVIAFVVVPSHCCLCSICFCDRLHPRMMLKLSRRIDKTNGVERFKCWSTCVMTCVQLVQKSSVRIDDSTDLAHPVLNLDFGFVIWRTIGVFFFTPSGIHHVPISP